MDSNDCRHTKVKELIQKLHSLFPDKQLKLLGDVIKVYDPQINWTTSSQDVQTSSYNNWLQYCVEHLLSAVQTTSPNLKYTSAGTLDQAKEAVTDPMVQQVLFMFPDADEDWVRSTLIYSKHQYGDNIVDRTCNYMFENPFKYKKNSAAVSASNSSSGESEKTKHKDKLITGNSLRIDSNLLGPDSTSDDPPSSSGSSEKIKSKPVTTGASQKLDLKQSTSTWSELSTTGLSRMAAPSKSDLSKNVETKPSTTGYLRIDADLLELDSSSDEDLPSFLSHEFKASSSESSVSSKFSVGKPKPATYGLSQKAESKPSAFGSSQTTKPESSESSVSGISQNAESKPSGSGSSQATKPESSVPGLPQMVVPKASASEYLPADSNLLQHCSSCDEDLSAFLSCDFKASSYKSSVSLTAHIDKQEPSRCAVSQKCESEASTSGSGHVTTSKSSASRSSTETGPSQTVSYSTQMTVSKPSQCTSSSLSLIDGQNVSRSAYPSSQKCSASTHGEFSGKSSQSFQQSMASGDWSSVQCPQLSSTGQEEKTKAKSMSKDPIATQAKYLAEHLQIKMQQLRCLQRLNSYPDAVSSTSVQVNRKRSLSSEGLGGPSQFKRRTLSQPVLLSAPSTSVPSDSQNNQHPKGDSKLQLSRSRSQPCASSSSNQLNSRIGSIPQPGMYTTVVKGKKIALKRLQGARAPSAHHSRHHKNANQIHMRNAQVDVPCKVNSDVSQSKVASRSVSSERGSVARQRHPSAVPVSSSGNKSAHISVMHGILNVSTPSSDSPSVSMRNRTMPAGTSSVPTPTSSTSTKRRQAPGVASSLSMDASSKMNAVFPRAMMKRERSSKLEALARQARSLSVTTASCDDHMSSVSVSDATSMSASTCVTPSNGKTSAACASYRSAAGKPYRSRTRASKHESLSASTAGRSPRVDESTHHSVSSTSSRPNTEVLMSASMHGRSKSSASVECVTGSLPSTPSSSSRAVSKWSLLASTPCGSSNAGASTPHASRSLPTTPSSSSRAVSKWSLLASTPRGSSNAGASKPHATRSLPTTPSSSSRPVDKGPILALASSGSSNLGASSSHATCSSPTTPSSSSRPCTQVSTLVSSKLRASKLRASAQHTTSSLPSTPPLSSWSGNQVSMSASTPSGPSSSRASHLAAPPVPSSLGTQVSDARCLSASLPARSLNNAEHARFQAQSTSVGSLGGTASAACTTDRTPVPAKPPKQGCSQLSAKASTSSAPVSVPSDSSTSTATSWKPSPTAVLPSSLKGCSQSSMDSSLSKSTCDQSTRKLTPLSLASGSEAGPLDSDLQSETSEAAEPLSPTPKSPDSTNKNIVVIKEDATSSEACILTCESCFLSKDPDGMHQCGDGHVVCTKCVEERAKEALSRKTFAVLCPCVDCLDVVPRDNLERALPGMILDLLDENLRSEQDSASSDPHREDFVRCPSCAFGAVLNVAVKRFVCRNESCKAVSCRHCRQDWSGRDHSLCERGSGEGAPQEGVTADPSLQPPPHWSTTNMQGKIFVKELVQPSSQEWANVRALFSRTVADAHLKYIHRVQNPRLWRKYCVTRQNMLEDNGEKHLNEKVLFHGTTPQAVEGICREGFDWRMCGRHGIAYGQGAYFARDAVYSHRYAAHAQRGARATWPGSQGLQASSISQILLKQGTIVNRVQMASSRVHGTWQHTNSGVSNSSDRRTAQTSGTSTTAYVGQAQHSPNVHSNPPASGSGTAPSSAGLSVNLSPAMAARQVNVVDQTSFLMSYPINIGGARSQAKRPSSWRARAYAAQGRSMSGYATNQPSTSTAEEDPHGPKQYTMFVAKVLVGRSTLGSMEYRKPPPDNSFNDDRTFDSCVDDPANPRIFVIFDSSQAYPDYVISYTI